MKKRFALLLTLLVFQTLAYPTKTDTSLVKKHFNAILNTDGYRNFTNLSALNEVAEYIFSEFSKYADMVYYQSFEVGGVEYKNVVCSFGTQNSQRLVVGAHYDVCGNQDGADDNASGTVGLLELARQLKGQSLNHRIDLVAYTLEEPPFFRTENMGSYIHAKSLHDQKADVKGMLVLEMIGYFKDEKNTQDYPLGLLKAFYGSRGNYITLVKKMGAGKFVRQFCRKFKRTDYIRTKKFTGPASLPGIDFSDHLNYWKFDFPALMITDTAFYRNKNYHKSSDKLETLDLKRMATVIDAVLETLVKMK